MSRPGKKDPKLRKDGKCVTCEEEDAFVGGKLKNGVTSESDPFCSAKCARIYYEVEESADVGVKHTAIRNSYRKRGRKGVKPTIRGKPILGTKGILRKEN